MEDCRLPKEEAEKLVRLCYVRKDRATVTDVEVSSKLAVSKNDLFVRFVCPAAPVATSLQWSGQEGCDPMAA